MRRLKLPSENQGEIRASSRRLLQEMEFFSTGWLSERPRWQRSRFANGKPQPLATVT